MLIVAKAAMVAGHPLPVSAWTPVALIWQDVLAAVVFAVVVAPLPSSATRALYLVLVTLVAIEVPVARTMSSPLTWPMIRAARGALLDSIRHEMTMANAIGCGSVVGTAVIAPWWLSRLTLWPGKQTITAAAVLIGIGWIGADRVDLGGRERNAFGALWPVASLPPVAGDDRHDWRRSDVPADPADDLGQLRGAARGRNVVLILLESTAAQNLKMFGGDRDPMPNLTALAQDAVVFRNAYAVYPESIKELFAALCARDPAYDTAPELYANVPCAALPQMLKAAGYRTALFHSGRFAYLGMESVIEHRGYDVLEDAGAIGGNVNSSFGVDEPATVGRILGWIDRGREPFFVTYLPVAGHHPYSTQAPGPFPVTTERDQYLNALHEGDAALGELFAGLRARGLDRRTLFVIFGDHGEAFGQHDGNFAHTLYIYEENVHVPYVIAMPGAGRGQIVHKTVSVVDTAPTILDLLGVAGDSRQQGVSMLGPDPLMSLFFTDYSLGWLGLRDGCWKYLYEIASKRSRLFDLCADPGEILDRSAAERDRLTAYRDRLERWSAERRSAIISGR